VTASLLERVAGLFGLRRSLAVHGPASYRGNHTAYRRFVILTTPRTGSSYLRQLLRSHPRVIGYGELFNPGKIEFNTPGFDNRNKALRRLRDRDPAAFLETQIFRGYPAHIAAVGFKVHYFQLDLPRSRAARDYLASMPGLLVFHLARRNLLRAYLSSVVMERTGVTGIMSPAERRAPRVALDPGDCIRYFEHTVRQRSAYQQLFAATRLVPVVYEDLTDDFRAETTRLLAILGVEPAALTAKTVLQEVRPLREAITNYDDLRAALAGTPWAEFCGD